ncbi:MAG: hypothetical protein ICV73_00835 [Acetobacteraceae bacterium]|nr:hypothetical protein [Acetobacteraceae bacterium]
MSAAPADRTEDGDLFRHLPAIYRAGEGALTPFSVLVRALSQSHRDVEGRLASVPRMLDPRTAPSGFDGGVPSPPDGERWGFLEYLAGWVALDPAVMGGGGHPAAGGARDRRAAALRHLVENAAPLQAARGTLAGTRYLLEVLFDAGFEILERRWPAAFQAGVASSLGVDTLVMGEPPLDRCVTLLWDSARLREAVAPDGAARGVFELAAGDRRIGTVVLAEGDDAESWAPRPEAREQLQRLRAVLEREMPVHILCYVGFKPDGGPGAPELHPFVVEVTSTVGHIQLQRKP